MRRSIIFLSICALLAIAGCEGINPYGEKPENVLSISLDCGTVNTKTTETGTEDGVGNENLIKTVDYFLFNAGADEENDTYYFKGRATANATSHYTFYISSSLVDLGNYEVFTIVNYPGSESDLGVNGKSSNNSDKRTKAQLKAILLQESTARTFTASPSSGKITPAAEADLALVMTGSGTMEVTENAAGNHIGSSTIDLTRLASKLSIDFYIKDQIVRTIDSVTETWVALTEGNNIRVYLCNGAESVYLGGTLPNPSSLFDYQPNTSNTAITGKTGFTTAFSSAAFYTYPENWTQGGADEPYLKLIIPWRLTRSSSDGDITSQKECYYKVMLPTDHFAANCWYHLILDVAQVGSDTDEDVVNLTCGYQVANWGTNQEIASAMTPAYYLDVNESVYDMVFYGNDLDIPYFASGSVAIQNVSITKTDFTNTANPTQNVTNDGFVALGADSDYIAIRHPLNTNYEGTAYDVSTYVFTFTLHLVDAGTSTAYDKTIRVTQYPPLYIDQVSSDGHLWINGYGYKSVTYRDGWNWYSRGTRLFDNRYSEDNRISSTNYTDYLGTIIDPTLINDSGANTNSHLYEVTATILDFDMEIGGNTVSVVIADSRSTTATNFNNDFSGTNGLSGNYYPAAENTQNVISPRFRIASSYGRVSPLSYEGAVRRCAAYQENGYPAGRWRLPTAAEIRFLMKLSADNKIPQLFDPDATNGYWAGGREACFKDNNEIRFDQISSDNGYTVSPSTGENDTAVNYTKSGTTYSIYTRCVYDTWYWGSDQHSDYNPSSPAWLGFKTSL